MKARNARIAAVTAVAFVPSESASATLDAKVLKATYDNTGACLIVATDYSGRLLVAQREPGDAHAEGAYFADAAAVGHEDEEEAPVPAGPGLRRGGVRGRSLHLNARRRRYLARNSGNKTGFTRLDSRLTRAARRRERNLDWKPTPDTRLKHEPAEPTNEAQNLSSMARPARCTTSALYARLQAVRRHLERVSTTRPRSNWCKHTALQAVPRRHH